MPNAVTFPAPCSTIVEQPQAPTVEQPRLHYPTGPPLDFSFQELSDIAGPHSQALTPPRRDNLLDSPHLPLIIHARAVPVQSCPATR